MVSSFVSHHFADVLHFSQLFFCQWLSFCCRCCFLWCCCNSYWLLSISMVVSYHFVVAFWLFCGCFVLKLKVFAVVLWVCSSFLTVTLTVGLVLVSVMHTVYVCLQPAAPKWFVLILFSHEDVKTGRIKSINSVLLMHAGLLCIEGLM